MKFHGDIPVLTRVKTNNWVVAVVWCVHSTFPRERNRLQVAMLASGHFCNAWWQKQNNSHRYFLLRCQYKQLGIDNTLEVCIRRFITYQLTVVLRTGCCNRAHEKRFMDVEMQRSMSSFAGSQDLVIRTPHHLWYSRGVGCEPPIPCYPPQQSVASARTHPTLPACRSSFYLACGFTTLAVVRISLSPARNMCMRTVW